MEAVLAVYVFSMSHRNDLNDTCRVINCEDDSVSADSETIGFLAFKFFHSPSPGVVLQGRYCCSHTPKDQSWQDVHFALGGAFNPYLINFTGTHDFFSAR